MKWATCDADESQEGWTDLYVDRICYNGQAQGGNGTKWSETPL